MKDRDNILKRKTSYDSKCNSSPGIARLVILIRMIIIVTQKDYVFVFRSDLPENIQSAEKYSEHFQEIDLAFLSSCA